MLKAIFLDVDGTLLSHETNRVPRSAAEALETLRKRGVRVFLATGRHRSALEQLKPLQGIAVDGYITLNGQYCTDETGVVYHCPVAQGDVLTLLDFLEEHPYPCIFVEAGEMYINFNNDRVAAVMNAIHSPLPRVGDLNRGRTNPIYQVCLYMNEEELATLPPLPGLRMTRWCSGGVDVLPAQGGKAAGIRKVLEHYGIDREDTMAFGDGENDVDMLGAVGIAVAMGNGCQAAKDAAHYVTDTVDGDGIRKALVHFGLL